MTGPHSSQEPDLPIAQGDVRAAPGVVISAGSLHFSFVSSSGPGGQNVNKRATKCTLRVALAELPLDAEALARLCRLGARYVTDDGELVIAMDEHRSQPRNKEACIERLRELVQQSLVKPKVRKKTKPSRGAKERRLGEKKRQGDRKRQRRDSGD
jgi:ribosome-associated protein